MKRGQSYSRFFHPAKSPRTVKQANGEVRQAKHTKPEGRLVWNSKKNGTFKGNVNKTLKRAQATNALKRRMNAKPA